MSYPHKASSPLWRAFQALCLVVLLAFALSGCASSGLVRHAFEYSPVTDSTDIEVLDYRYGDDKLPGSRAPRWRVERGEPSTGGIVNGEMRQGFDLYVKWRIKATGEILEDTADLRPRMPRDITDHRVYFIVKGRQLWVYLVTPEKLAAGAPLNDFRKYKTFKIITLYPLQPK